VVSPAEPEGGNARDCAATSGVANPKTNANPSLKTLKHRIAILASERQQYTPRLLVCDLNFAFLNFAFQSFACARKLSWHPAPGFLAAAKALYNG